MLNHAEYQELFKAINAAEEATFNKAHDNAMTYEESWQVARAQWKPAWDALERVRPAESPAPVLD